MTDGTPASLALQTALAYFRAWTSHDIDWAMTYIADGIICQAPGQRLEGAAAFRGFMGPFVQILTGSELIAAFGGDTTAVVHVWHRYRPCQGRSWGGVRHGGGWQDYTHADHFRPPPVRGRARPPGRDDPR